MKVPLSFARLSEDGLLEKALLLRGYKLQKRRQATTIYALHVEENREYAFDLSDDLSLEFTVAELLDLGFEPGEFKRCPNCGKLQHECDAERNDIAAHNEHGG